MRVKIFQNRQIQIRTLQVHQQRQKTSREKMKDLKDRKETIKRTKSWEKLIERMEHQDKTLDGTMYSLQRNIAPPTQTVSQAFIMMSQAMNQGSLSTPIPATPRQD